VSSKLCLYTSSWRVLSDWSSSCACSRCSTASCNERKHDCCRKMSTWFAFDQHRWSRAFLRAWAEPHGLSHGIPVYFGSQQRVCCVLCSRRFCIIVSLFSAASASKFSTVSSISRYDLSNNRLPIAKQHGLPVAKQHGLPVAKQHGLPVTKQYGLPVAKFPVTK